ncbi:MAG: substrate-binding domain-containing protein [Oscillatoria princeps RMCB-10]|jgi:phosphate transport system substrate-binding protein|nr:substrate-binding domain-containing protein [Oscillatoria princeps RMCB-10]
MENINQALKKHFEENFTGTNVELNARGSDAALKALLDEKIDIAAIGRPLTPEEKARYQVQVPLSRHKIALIAAPDNPFEGELTFDKFALIFRG